MSYYASRKDEQYYRVVRRWLEQLSPESSLLDVGCLDTPVATWGTFATRYTVDPRPRPPLPHVTAIANHWPAAAANLPQPIAVVTCLQVLEHVADPHAFAAELFAAATTAVIISVPYRWAAGACKYHLHDPIDLAKLQRWTDRGPNRAFITHPPRRAVALYRL